MEHLGGEALFVDRADAGRRLAASLQHLRGEPVVVLGLPGGGVPGRLRVAKALGAPLDVIVVRKLGVPFQPELGMGALGEDGVRLVDCDVVRQAGVSERDSMSSRRGNGRSWSVALDASELADHTSPSRVAPP